MTLFIAPVLIYFFIPESPRWLLRRGRVQDAVETVNLLIRRCGGKVEPMSVAELGPNVNLAGEQLPPFTALFGPGQLRWTVVGILCGLCGATCYYCSAILLPKALVDQGAGVTLSFGLSTLIFGASIPGKLFNGYIMEVIGRRWTITLSFLCAIPGLLLMMMAHNFGAYSETVFVIGVLITGFTVLSCFPAVRVYISEQFPTSLRGRGHFFDEVVRPAARRRVHPVPAGAAYRVGDGLLRQPRAGGDDRRAGSGAVRPRDDRAARELYRDRDHRRPAAPGRPGAGALNGRRPALGAGAGRIGLMVAAG